MEEQNAARATTEWHHIRIKPTETGLDPERVTTSFERLHHLGTTIEFLLVSDGERVDYYAGTTPDEIDRLERILRDCFPDEYELTRADPALDSRLDTVEDVTTVEFTGRGERRKDWQTRLTPVAGTERETLGSLPLVSTAETVAEATTPVVYQALVEPKLDWRPEATMRIDDLERNADTMGQRLFKPLFGDLTADDKESTLPSSHERRIEAIETKDGQHSFAVHARAVAVGENARATLTKLEPAFEAASGDFYHVDPRVQTGESATNTVEHIRERTVEEPSLDRRLTERLPITSNHRRELVTDPTTTPNVTLLSGARLGTTGKRGLDATPDERTSVDRPPEGRLEWYRGPGMPLGHLKTEDGTVDEEPLTLPPTLQRLHVALFGRTRSGKSVALISILLWNAVATDGADIFIDSKGDGMPVEYMRAHYALHGDLDDVYYFDCTELLPAVSLLDIRDQLESGIDRSIAIEDAVDHYIEVLVGIMGHERFYRAVRSPDIIRYLVKALFDPVHGSDAFTHRDLQQAARRMHGTRDAPPVTDPDLQEMLGGVAANSERSFHELMQGVANRIEKVPSYERLGQLFNHVPENEDDPEFDLRKLLDEDATIIIDTSGLRPENRRGVTLVLLSELWTALRRRARETEDGPSSTDERSQQPVSGDGGTTGVDGGDSVAWSDSQDPEPEDGQAPEDLPLVNLYLEEAAEYATSDLLSELLSQGRGFGLSMTLAMQFPGQLEEESSRAYSEVLNNVGTVVTGNVAVDSALTTRLATEDMPPSEVGNRLRALSRGEWLASVPAPFDETPPRPFVLESMPLPTGHPKGEDPLSEAREDAFQGLLEVVHDRTRMQYGLEVGTDHEAAETETAGEHRPGPSTELSGASTRVDTALPYTRRLPSMVEYDEAAHALVCGTCSDRYDPTIHGMRRAINCCHDLDTVDRVSGEGVHTTQAECLWSLLQPWLAKFRGLSKQGLEQAARTYGFLRSLNLTGAPIHGLIDCVAVNVFR